MADDEWRRRLSRHMRLTGAHRYIYDVYLNGEPTEISQIINTERGKTVKNVFICGDDEFDYLERGKEGLREWLESHAGQVGGTGGMS